MESQRDAVPATPAGSGENENTGDRGTAWRREDLSEESTAQGTRGDVGQSGGVREDAPPTPGFTQERGPAGSVSDAAAETGVSEHSE